jgi:hypothetical protein
MRGGITFSVGLHIAVLLVAWLGLPSLRAERLPAEQLMIVEMVDIAELTNAPPKPLQEAKPKAPPPPPKPQAAPPLPPMPKMASPKKPEPPKVAAPKVTPPPAKKQKPPPSKPKKPPAKVEAPKVAPPPLPKKPAKAAVAKPPKSTPKPVSRPKPPPKPQPTKVAKPSPKKPVKAPPKALPKKQAKPAETEFSKLLKSVAKMKPKPVAKETLKPDAPLPELAKSPVRSSENRFDVTAKLSISELDAIRDQIADCWLVPAGAKNAEDLIVDIFVRMNPDGTVRAADIKDKGRMRTDPFFRTAAESAIRALRNPRCSPLRLPLDKYELWKTFTIGFNPRDLLG